jgi:hypothetical protein
MPVRIPTVSIAFGMQLDVAAERPHGALQVRGRGGHRERALEQRREPAAGCRAANSGSPPPRSVAIHGFRERAEGPGDELRPAERLAR